MCVKPHGKYVGAAGCVTAWLLSVFCWPASAIIGCINCHAFDDEPPAEGCRCCIQCCRDPKDPVLQRHSTAIEIDIDL